ncbi:hypothetical protein V3C99_014274 [Haemonchus contortus]
MFKEALVAVCVAFAAAIPCESDTVDGIWSFTLDTSVVSYALGGEELNPKYNCFDYSKDGNALQKFRVDLKHPLIFNITDAKHRTSQLANLKATAENVDKRNANTCIDAQLRGEIEVAVKDAADSCEGIVKALASKLNRPGWAMNCVNRSPKGYSVGFFFDDEHFCRYDVVKGDKVYSLDIVKLDKSEPVPEE